MQENRKEVIVGTHGRTQALSTNRVGALNPTRKSKLELVKEKKGKTLQHCPNASPLVISLPSIKTTLHTKFLFYKAMDPRQP